MKKIYLDNAATTKVDPSVLKKMTPFLKENYGNTASVHQIGVNAKSAVEEARQVVAESLNSKPEEVYFTSGGTEGNNWALKGLFFENFPNKNHIITTKIEHDCVIETCKWLEKKGAKVTYLDVDKNGLIDLDQLKKSITKKTFLVSIIHANNEIGAIQNLNEIGKVTKEKKVLFHTDACQSYTKVPIDAVKMNLDLVTINSHKIHGPKGVGALYIKDGTKITPLLHGGGHERQRRSGTLNVAGIVGFGQAVNIAKETNWKKVEKLRDKLIEGILTITNTKLNGPKENRLSNNVNVTFRDVEGEAVGGFLETYGIYVSTGSACLSNTDAQSHVLSSIGLTKKEQLASIRMSLSKYTRERDIDYVLKVLPKIIKKLRGINRG